MNLELKKQAQDLRRQGYLFSEIADQLHISRSTAHTWTEPIILSDTEKKLIFERKTKLQRAKMINLTTRRREYYLKREALLLKKARAIVESANGNADTARIMCALLYWCEGNKDVSGGIKFTNADPLLVKKFLFLLRQGFNVNEAKFRALLHLHEYHDPGVQLGYWSKVTNIPTSQFHKTYIKPHTGKNKHTGYPGCISIRYLDVSFGKLLKMIYSEYSLIS